MRKKDFDKVFIQQIVDNLNEYSTAGFLDKPRIYMMYNDITDNLNKEGIITNKQRFEWCTPEKAVNLKYLKSKK